MKRYRRDDLKQTLQRNLKADENGLKSWLESPAYIDGDLVGEFWGHIQKAPAVAIVGDYDCDGICATYCMAKTIKEVMPDQKLYLRIPKRFSEGYGLNEKIVEEIEARQPKGSVVITVDNGIAAADLLERLEADGYKVLMTDHHILREGNRIPNVTMTIDPSVAGCDKGFSFKKWCGAAVAFKLCEQMISETLAKELEVFAGIATVADCMELTAENWALVRKTIESFHCSKAPEALKNMLLQMGQDPRFANEDSFGYYLGPCFNASGRLLDNGATKVLKYLLNPTEEGLTELVNNNNRRRELRDNEFQIVKEYIEKEGIAGNCPIWVDIPELHGGIVGILAGQVTEEYGVPAIVLTHSKDDPYHLKGSARTAGEIDVFKYLQSLGDVYERVGGHPGAAGLSMTRENFEKVRNISCDRPKDVTPAGVVPKNAYHIVKEEIPEINDILEAYRPFGEGNPAPAFDMTVNTKTDSVRMIGKEKNHLCIEGKDHSYKITHFYHDPNDLSDKHVFGLYGKISGSYYCGIETPTLNADGVYDLGGEKEEEEELIKE